MGDEVTDKLLKFSKPGEHPILGSKMENLPNQEYDFPNPKMEPPGKHPERLGVFEMKTGEPGTILEIHGQVGNINTVNQTLRIEDSVYSYGTYKDFNKQPEEIDLDTLDIALRILGLGIPPGTPVRVMKLVKALQDNPDITLKEIKLLR